MVNFQVNQIKILKDEKIVDKVEIEDLEPVYEMKKQELEQLLKREAMEEEVISYIIFPQIALIEEEKVKINEIQSFEIFGMEV